MVQSSTASALFYYCDELLQHQRLPHRTFAARHREFEREWRLRSLTHVGFFTCQQRDLFWQIVVEQVLHVQSSDSAAMSRGHMPSSLAHVKLHHSTDPRIHVFQQILGPPLHIARWTVEISRSTAKVHLKTARAGQKQLYLVL
jgi:hypothetical protein